MNASIYYTKVYNNKTALRREKTNPIQTHSKPVLPVPSLSEGSAVEWANKIALKIYPFGIDCPIVFEEELFWFVG
jgi:hypothetical protein